MHILEYTPNSQLLLRVLLEPVVRRQEEAKAKVAAAEASSSHEGEGVEEAATKNACSCSTRTRRRDQRRAKRRWRRGGSGRRPGRRGGSGASGSGAVATSQGWRGGSGRRQGRRERTQSDKTRTYSREQQRIQHEEHLNNTIQLLISRLFERGAGSLAPLLPPPMHAHCRRYT